MGPSQLRPERLQEQGRRKQFILNDLGKSLKLRIKRFMEEYDPVQI